MNTRLRVFGEAMGSGATPAQMHNNISKALKSAGFKVKKFQKKALRKSMQSNENQ